ncbi:MAG TPA: LLM class flavin-dependent oxidoreductase [Nitrososphaerales archaeon]|nr:LLM class flavin-dependent oxidoreductase [Nitrososphaerales archaeon]
MNTRFGTVVASIGAKDAIEYAIESEKLGFDSVWVTDHLIDDGGIKVEPWSIFGALSSITKKIMMCTAVTDAIRMHPARIAHTVATLDQLSSGRVALGIGAGEAMNLTPFGLPFEDPKNRSKRLGEAIQAIRLLWKSTRKSPVSFDGQFYQLKNAWLDIQLGSPKTPPIYVGALGGNSTLKVAGRYGDGWLPWLNSPETYRMRLETVKEAARSAGRDTKEMDFALYLYACLAEDEQEEKKALNHTKRALLVEAHTLKLLGVDHPSVLGLPYQRMLVDDSTEKALINLEPLVPDEVARACIAVGSPKEIERTIAQFEKAGATHIALQLLPQNSEHLKRFSEKVLPRLKS